jgi:hypothetical protein
MSVGLDRPDNSAEDKGRHVTIGFRIPEELRLLMEDVAYVTDRLLTEVFLSALSREIEAVRKEYGDIPPRPRRRASGTSPVRAEAAAEAEAGAEAEAQSPSAAAARSPSAGRSPTAKKKPRGK